MSEEKKKNHRSVDVIQSEYSSLCSKAGHVQYQIYALSKELETVNNTLRDLNFEAAASKAAAEETKKVEVPENA